MEEGTPVVGYQAKLHWIIFAWPILLVVGGLVLNHYRHYTGYVGLMFIGAGALLFVLNYLTYLTSFIRISEKSVQFQSGILATNTMDIPFSKIESVDIRFTIVGSFLDYGTIIITGTGGTHNLLKFVAAPLTCRRVIEQAMNR